MTGHLFLKVNLLLFPRVCHLIPIICVVSSSVVVNCFVDDATSALELRARTGRRSCKERAEFETSSFLKLVGNMFRCGASHLIHKSPTEPTSTRLKTNYSYKFTRSHS